MTNLKYYILLFFLLLEACHTLPEGNTSKSKAHLRQVMPHSTTLRPRATVDTINQHKMVDSLYRQLQTAYEANSTKQLEVFLQNWAIYSAKQHNHYPASDMVAPALTQLFIDMFSPFDFSPFGWKQRKEKTDFTGVKYLVIQGQLPYAIDFAKNVPWDTLRHFSPPIKYKGVTTLYFHEIYQKVFDKFLTDEVSYKKRDFLGKLLNMPLSLVADITTQPKIYQIQLNTKLNGAVVDYYLEGSFMRSWLMKQGNHWVIVHNEQTGIE
ncbi:hypothetical protein [uncultured Microscilla sp.]|uniref:hypothetical protein n=1 Tax=uncultured Microscilla sp. TaxID=432653 RepID=UPI002612D7CA|nr:hypothetical protein [uncultured Microscilla sp.]